MKIKIFLLIAGLSLWLAGCSQATPAPLEPTLTKVVAETPIAESPTNTPESEVEAPVSEITQLAQLPLVDDFETGELLSGQAGSAPVGFITWSDGSAVSIQTVTVEPGDALALPDQAATNIILQLNTDISPGGWSGFSHAFASPALDAWVPQDWSPYEGISMWLYGNNTGGALFIDILDNRSATSSMDDAERWTHQIPDDFTGWQQIQIPFTEFTRKDIGNSAPNDGFTLTEVHGYALGAFGSANMGAQANYLDQVMLYGEAGERPVEISLAETTFQAKESGLATIKLKLNKPAAEIVSVQYLTIEGNATSGVDYTLPGDKVIFEPGQMTQSFKIPIVDDTLAEGNEQTLVVLYNPTGAVLNPQSRAILTIRDNEAPDPDFITDFNQFPPFFASEGVDLSLLTVAPEGELALPDQIDPENILAVNYPADQLSANFGHFYPQGQDWSQKAGLSFWYYGANTGEPVNLELLGAPAATSGEAAPGDWSLTWSDEFDDPAGTSPNPAIWQPEIGDGMLNGIPGWGNGELEYYTAQPENAATDGAGNLVITAQKIDPAASNLMCWYGPCEYTSARLITRDRAEFEFGRVEARM
ncbi:MAG TPA: hypothetical protein DEH22_01680, partial [Chloroflexi bacterium]|nr:hypothetical protein [Chloroflexota bacterium]